MLKKQKKASFSDEHAFFQAIENGRYNQVRNLFNQDPNIVYTKSNHQQSSLEIAVKSIIDHPHNQTRQTILGFLLVRASDEDIANRLIFLAFSSSDETTRLATLNTLKICFNFEEKGTNDFYFEALQPKSAFSYDTFNKLSEHELTQEDNENSTICDFLILNQKKIPAQVKNLLGVYQHAIDIFLPKIQPHITLQQYNDIESHCHIYHAYYLAKDNFANQQLDNAKFSLNKLISLLIVKNLSSTEENYPLLSLLVDAYDKLGSIYEMEKNIESAACYKQAFEIKKSIEQFKPTQPEIPSAVSPSSSTQSFSEKNNTTTTYKLHQAPQSKSQQTEESILLQIRQIYTAAKSLAWIAPKFIPHSPATEGWAHPYVLELKGDIEEGINKYKEVYDFFKANQQEINQSPYADQILHFAVRSLEMLIFYHFNKKDNSHYIYYQHVLELLQSTNTTFAKNAYNFFTKIKEPICFSEDKTYYQPFLKDPLK